VLKDGYYHTGDAGLMDKGHLIYLDRMDEMIELSDGKKFSPQYTEIRLRFSPYIKDVMVFGGEDKPSSPPFSISITITWGNGRSEER